MPTAPIAATIALLLASCATPPRTTPAAPGPERQSWQCRNDLEIQCGEGACSAATGDDFTPMSVTVEASGNMAVCAYSGCWEGTGEVVADGPFLVVIGRELQFSTATGGAPGQDVVVAIDRTDSVGILKAGGFAQPVHCRRRGPNSS